MLLPRKRCPQCGQVYEGQKVPFTHSCDRCGNGHLTNMEPRDTEADESAILPRGGTITHTRDNF